MVNSVTVAHGDASDSENMRWVKYNNFMESYF
jgi:hypothetical protein